MRVSQIMTLAEAQARLTAGVLLQIDLREWSSARWQDLHELVLAHPGPSQLYFRCASPEGRNIELMAGELYKVKLDDGFLDQAAVLLGGPKFEFVATRELPRGKSSYSGPRRGTVRS
jgi:hypothetical protein